MASKVLAFAHRVSYQPGWGNDELAELYRVQHALVQARIAIETDRGVTDEGDPWFIFCRPGGEVIVHATRYDGVYRLYSPVLPQPLTGSSFAALTRSFLSGLRTPVQTDATVSIHPAALLSVLIAAIFYSVDFHSGSAQAAEASRDHDNKAAESTHVQSEPVTTGTLFQTFVTSVKALLEPAADAASHPFTFLAGVEAAAMAAVAVALSGLTEFGTGSTSELVTKAAADDQQCVTDCQNGVLAHHQLNDKGNLESASDATSQVAVIALAQDDPHFGQYAKQILLLAGASDDTGVGNGNAFVSSNESIVAPTTDSQTITIDTTERDVVALIAVANGSVLAAETRNELPAVGSHSSEGTLTATITLSNEDTASISSSDNVQAIDVVLSHGGGSLDLSEAASIGKITVTGDGNLQISGITSTENPQLVLGAGSAEAVSLSFGVVATASFSIQLDGQIQLSLGSIYAYGAAVQLTLDSEGSVANTVTVGDTAIVGGTTLALKIIGLQDLTLNESAVAFNQTSVDASGLSGALTISLDLNNVFESVDLSQVKAANFVVADDGNVAFLNAASGSHIQLGSNLNVVDFTVQGATNATPGSLALNLATDSPQAASIAINLLDVFFTSTLAIDSTGAGSTGANTIETLTDTSLSNLTITGDSALAVNSINGPSAGDSQNITIDAHALTGSLLLNASDISDTAMLGRSITIIAGSASNYLTNLTISESTNFVVGAGHSMIFIGGGAINDSIAGLSASDEVLIGLPAHNDVVVNTLNAGTAQGIIDSQSNLTAAAQVASTLADSSAAQQALLFSYQGSQYVFIDATGNHLFDASHDAIIKLAGLIAGADLTNVFHSA